MRFRVAWLGIACVLLSGCPFYETFPEDEIIVSVSWLDPGRADVGVDVNLAGDRDWMTGLAVAPPAHVVEPARYAVKGNEWTELTYVVEGLEQGALLGLWKDGYAADGPCGHRKYWYSAYDLQGEMHQSGGFWQDVEYSLDITRMDDAFEVELAFPGDAPVGTYDVIGLPSGGRDRRILCDVPLQDVTQVPAGGDVLREWHFSVYLHPPPETGFRQARENRIV